MFRLFLLLPLVLGLGSCTKTSGYRQSPEETVEKLSPQVSLGHVEIDDQGELISYEQLQRVTRQIKKESSEPLLLVVYIHGWNHNASKSRISGGGNLEDFREKLTNLGRARGKKTMGVFVSWRGRSLSTFPVGVDYFHRHASAKRVGGTAGTEVLHELGAAARGANSQNEIVMIGHSLGGAILESAMAGSIAAKVASASAKGEKLKRTDFPADLIVTVNSAEYAIYARKILATFKNRGIREIEGGPLMVALTSEKDVTTSFLSPMGNLIGRWVPGVNFFNTGVAGLYRRDPREDYLRGTQAAAHRTTVGHFRPLFSHEYQKAGEGEESLQGILRANRNPKRPGGFLVTGKDAGYFYRRPSEEVYNDTPYWIIPVPGSFIRGHEDQWNDSFFVGMTTALLAMTR